MKWHFMKWKFRKKYRKKIQIQDKMYYYYDLKWMWYSREHDPRKKNLKKRKNENHSITEFLDQCIQSTGNRINEHVLTLVFNLNLFNFVFLSLSRWMLIMVDFLKIFLCFYRVVFRLLLFFFSWTVKWPEMLSLCCVHTWKITVWANSSDVKK